MASFLPPIPYVSHTPVLRQTADGYLIDHQTEEFLQATRLVAGLVGGPAVYYGGAVLASEGHPVLGNTLKVMGVACSAYHLWQYATVKYVQSGLRNNTAKPGKTMKRIGLLANLAKTLRAKKHIDVPDDANIIEEE